MPKKPTVVKRAQLRGDGVVDANGFIRAFYSDAMERVKEMIGAGKANIYTGFQGSLLLADMLHGGAYAAPVNLRPYFMKDPTQSPYYAGDLENLNQGGGLAGLFAKIGAGQDAADLWKQLLMNANVPHVMPKLISDEAFGQFMILHAQAGTNFIVQGAATGLKTLVEGTTELFGEEPGTRAVKGVGRLSKEALAFLRGGFALAADTNNSVG